MKFKTLFLTAIMMMAVAFGAQAADRYVRDVKALPQAAQATLAKNFKAKVSFIKVDTTLGHVDEYDVVLTDGTEVTFDNKGNWRDIETSASTSVPAVFIPKAMSSYVKREHPGRRIVGLERKGKGYEAELDNGIEMKFDANGLFQRYED
ncbi:MAG: PepSY-like domain-containing protein [Muribaculaceae bacterium]|nr:PepSY-like domain-containing protein [Muribaculaceae bacterium]